MCNDIKIAHKAWLQSFEDTRDKRQRLATLHTEKMSNLEQEEIQLKKKISDKEIEGLKAKVYSFQFFQKIYSI